MCFFSRGVDKPGNINLDYTGGGSARGVKSGLGDEDSFIMTPLSPPGRVQPHTLIFNVSSPLPQWWCPLCIHCFFLCLWGGGGWEIVSTLFIFASSI